MRAVVWGFAAAWIAAPALAAPCDQFSDPLAYNSCLARQGPAARAVHVGPAPRQAAAAPGGHGRTGRAQGRIVIARPHGRAEMVFTPGR